MATEFEKFTISQVGILIRDNKCLILEFASMPGRWGLPGGRIDKGELGEEAFKRELREEIRLENFEVADIVDFDIWHTSNGTPVSAVAYYIRNENDPIELSPEHLSMTWITESEIENYDFVWKNAKRMLYKGFLLHKKLTH